LINETLVLDVVLENRMNKLEKEERENQEKIQEEEKSTIKRQKSLIKFY
jgi:hypothetical protein